MKTKCRFFAALLLIFFMLTNVTAAYDYDYADEITDTEELSETGTGGDQASETASNPQPKFQVNAKSAILIEAGTGEVVFAMNEHEKLPIASITKIMTMLLVMEAVDSGKISLKDTVTISSNASRMGGSQVYLEEGEVFTVEELLKAVAVHSANDASVALAEKVAGSEEAFVQLMNEKARELKMNNTNFLDATGLTDEGHYSTAYDVALMSRELLTRHPRIINYTTIWHDSFRDGKFDLDNTNKLVKRYSGITGLKTGFTSKAGFCLAASAERDGTHFISVVLGAESNEMRFSESAKLLDFGFANWETARIEKKGLPAGTVRVKKGEVSEVPLEYGDNVVILVQKGKKGKLVENPEMPESVTAPVTAGQVVGMLNIELDGNRMASIPIVAAGESRRCNFGLLLGMLFKKWAGLFCCGREESLTPDNTGPTENPQAPENTSPPENNAAPGSNPVTEENPTDNEGVFDEDMPYMDDGSGMSEDAAGEESSVTVDDYVPEDEPVMDEEPIIEDELWPEWD
jgi:Penicillin-binding protein 5, C-terminal domain./D-alanyl-D-alanine carboxypeptidase.